MALSLASVRTASSRRRCRLPPPPPQAQPSPPSRLGYGVVRFDCGGIGFDCGGLDFVAADSNGWHQTQFGDGEIVFVLVRSSGRCWSLAIRASSPRTSGRGGELHPVQPDVVAAGHGGKPLQPPWERGLWTSRQGPCQGPHHRRSVKPEAMGPSQLLAPEALGTLRHRATPRAPSPLASSPSSSSSAT
nr:unnamed protein product [Digitaria exilis]